MDIIFTLPVLTQFQRSTFLAACYSMEEQAKDVDEKASSLARILHNESPPYSYTCNATYTRTLNNHPVCQNGSIMAMPINANAKWQKCIMGCNENEAVVTKITMVTM